MSEVVRLDRYTSLLSSRTAVSTDELMAALEVSRATLKRDIAKFRDQLHVPIRFNREFGSYLLSFPYADDQELIGDIMRYGADVQVLAPAGLRSKVQRAFLAAVSRYL